MFRQFVTTSTAIAALQLGMVGMAQAADKARAASPPASSDPYQNYGALDAYLGDGFLERLVNYYKLEMGKDGPPSDPSAPTSRRAEFPPAPQTAPPMPFTEWPYGGSTNLGTTRPSSVDSPLMVALGNTSGGQWLNDNHIQIYGWFNAGGNLSTNHRQAGNFPISYDYNPNRVQLDQAVMYIERLPDTVQKDHVDFGFRIAPIVGTDYRYTTSYGLFSNQLLKGNHNIGYDIPMAYGEVFIPQVAEGLLLRFGRFIALPDIEAQLAPNNYMYSHSLAYTFDNYTNYGLQSTLAANKNLFLQLGLTFGSDTVPWNVGKRMTNLDPNPLYPGQTLLKDPGALPSVTGCIRYQTDSGNDAIYGCADAINKGVWGYNNLQWYGGTYYHKFNDQWHISLEAYNLYQDKVANVNNAIAADALANGGTPFSPQYIRRNAPNPAKCNDVNALTCTASAQAYLAYLNYRVTSLDNISFRAEFYNDNQGQRTGTKTRYLDFGLGLQHWFSPQIELRPEVSYYKALDAPAFNGNANRGIAPNKTGALVASADIIFHY